MTPRRMRSPSVRASPLIIGSFIGASPSSCGYRACWSGSDAAAVPQGRTATPGRPSPPEDRRHGLAAGPRSPTGLFPSRTRTRSQGSGRVPPNLPNSSFLRGRRGRTGLASGTSTGKTARTLTSPRVVNVVRPLPVTCSPRLSVPDTGEPGPGVTDGIAADRLDDELEALGTVHAELRRVDRPQFGAPRKNGVGIDFEHFLAPLMNVNVQVQWSVLERADVIARTGAARVRYLFGTQARTAQR
jgi:hypothetical protein